MVSYKDIGIFAGHKNHFNIWADTTTQGLPYDYRSIMHPDALRYSGDDQLTIVPSTTNIPMQIMGTGIGGLPTPLDFMHINLFYCEGRVNACLSMHS